MGLLSALGRMSGRGARRGGQMSAQAVPEAQMMRSTIPDGFMADPRGQEFMMRLQARADELRAQPFLPPRLRNELQETEAILEQLGVR